MSRSLVFALPVVVCQIGCSASPTSTGAPGAGGGGTSEAQSSTVSTTDAGASSASSGASGEGGGPPTKPADLASFIVGSPADARVTPLGPGLILMGGGTDVDAAFTWWSPKLAGGDVVVLRTSGADGYDDYLYTTIGGCDSVETMLVTTTALANSDYVAYELAHAEGIFIAGGDQATYVEAWKGTRVEAELEAAWNRGAIVGGTSAGCAILGDYAFAALNGSVYSDEALTDPYNTYMTMERDFLDFPAIGHVITDTHFSQRDRMGRLIAFVARPIADGWSSDVLGLGIDEATALLVEGDGQAKVVGQGAVYAIQSAGAPSACVARQPLTSAGLTLRKLLAGDTIALPSGSSPVSATTLGAASGMMQPANPY